MNTVDTKQVIDNHIKNISAEAGKPLKEIHPEQTIMEGLGFNSLQIATLVSFLETDLGVDIFSSDTVTVADIRTVGDLYKAYQTMLKQ